MTWQEKVERLENDGRFTEASRVFAYAHPNPSYAQKMKFADRMYQKKAFREATLWYAECIGTPIRQDCYYLTEVGCTESGLSEAALSAISQGDKLFIGENYRAATEYYRSAADESRYAMTKLAECYFLLEEYAKAKEIYRQQVQVTDDGYLMFMIGECYMHEMANEYAYEHAVYWYQYALDHGNVYPYYPLGLAYQFGYGVEQDIKRAEELYLLGTKYAVDRDNCYCKLGNLCYERGEYERAKDYYAKASALNNARALLNIAVGYLNRDLRLDRAQALCMLAKAAALGNQRAAELYRNLKGSVTTLG